MEELKRVEAAIKAKGSDIKNELVAGGTRDDGSVIWGERTPLAKVRAGDVVALCDAVKDPDKIVNDLRLGSAGVPMGNKPIFPPETEVQPQVQCLLHLISKVKANGVSE